MDKYDAYKKKIFKTNKYIELPFIKKVITAFTVLWAASCAAMYWSMHSSAPAVAWFFILFAVILVGIAWGLFAIAHYLQKFTTPRPPQPRGIPTTMKRDKKKEII